MIHFVWIFVIQSLLASGEKMLPPNFNINNFVGKALQDEKDMDSSLSTESCRDFESTRTIRLCKFTAYTTKKSIKEFLVLIENLKTSPYQFIIHQAISFPAIRVPLTGNGELYMGDACHPKHSVWGVATYVKRPMGSRKYKVLKAWQADTINKKIIKVPVSEVTCMEENEDEP